MITRNLGYERKNTISPSLTTTTTTTRKYKVSLGFAYLICLANNRRTPCARVLTDAATLAAAIETNEENKIAPFEVGSNHILITSMQMEFRALIVRD